jgi:uncharacterized protein DUF2510
MIVIEQAQTLRDMTGNPVGWYRDPHGPAGHRYWDGKAWLEAAGVPSRGEADCTNAVTDR